MIFFLLWSTFLHPDYHNSEVFRPTHLKAWAERHLSRYAWPGWAKTSCWLWPGPGASNKEMRCVMDRSEINLTLKVEADYYFIMYIYNLWFNYVFYYFFFIYLFIFSYSRIWTWLLLWVNFNLGYSTILSTYMYTLLLWLESFQTFHYNLWWAQQSSREKTPSSHNVNTEDRIHHNV